MITTDHFDPDRQFDVKLLGQLRLQLNAVEFQAAAQPLKSNVFHQSRHLSLSRQLTEKRTEGLLHLYHLLTVSLEVCSEHCFGLQISA